MRDNLSARRLENKKAVVTGASSGIGREVALTLAHHGAYVIANYNHSSELTEQVVETIIQRGGNAAAVQADVSNPVDVDRLIEESASLLGNIDIWVNIAGADILTGSASEQSDLEKLASLINVDLKGTMMCSWRIAEFMEKSGGGVIINTSWDLALHGMEGRNPEMFAAVKAGVAGFSKCLARSSAPLVRVNDVAPGWIETEFAKDVMSKEYYAGVINDTPLRRFGLPKDVAAAVLYLVSDEASFITGQTLKVNGGVV